MEHEVVTAFAVVEKFRRPRFLPAMISAGEDVAARRFIDR